MVSNSLGMELQELLDTLARIKQESADDQQYQEIRSALPDEWPM
ncbi:MAG: hypothetical protein ACE5Q6_04860 [Dehalococcoidia bacterium]